MPFGRLGIWVKIVTSASTGSVQVGTFGGGSSSVRLCSESQVERALTSRRGAED